MYNSGVLVHVSASTPIDNNDRLKRTWRRPYITCLVRVMQGGYRDRITAARDYRIQLSATKVARHRCTI